MCYTAHSVTTTLQAPFASQLGLVVCNTHVCYQVADTVAVSPLIVIPGHQLQDKGQNVNFGIVET